MRSKGKRSQGVLRKLPNTKRWHAPAETEILTFSNDRLPESDSLFPNAEDTILPVLALSMVSSGFASLFPSSSFLKQSKSLYIFPIPQTSASGCVLWGTRGGEFILKGNFVITLSQENLFWMPSTLNLLNETSSCQLQPCNILCNWCVFHWNRWCSLQDE